MLFAGKASVGAHACFCVMIAHLMLTHGAHDNLDSSIYGFHHVGITTSDLEKSQKFYVDVLGGSLVDDLKGNNLQGDEEMYVLFQKEILDAHARNVSLDEEKVPSVSRGGDVGLSIRFVLFDNLVVELLEFSEPGKSQVYDANYKYATAAYVNTVTVSFWVRDNVDLNDFITRLETISNQLSIGVKVNHATGNAAATTFGGSEMNVEGISVAHVVGPSGELVEFVKFTGVSRSRLATAFHSRKAVSKAFSSSTTCSSAEPLGTCLYGVHHIGVTTDDIAASLKFYSDVMGGTVLTSLTMNNVNSDGVYYSFFRQEILQASHTAADLSAAGIPDIATDGTEKCDFVFVLFSNMVIRLGRFSSRPAGDVLFNARHLSSSPAYVSSGHLTFWVKETVDLNQFVQNVEAASRNLDLKQVQGNRAVDVASASDLDKVPLSKYSYSISGTLTNFDGLTYTYIKGPSGEQLEFLQLTGKANDAFRTAFCDRDAVSTAYSRNNCPHDASGKQDQ